MFRFFSSIVPSCSFFTTLFGNTTETEKKGTDAKEVLKEKIRQLVAADRRGMSSNEEIQVLALASITEEIVEKKKQMRDILYSRVSTSTSIALTCHHLGEALHLPGLPEAGLIRDKIITAIKTGDQYRFSWPAIYRILSNLIASSRNDEEKKQTLDFMWERTFLQTSQGEFEHKECLVTNGLYPVLHRLSPNDIKPFLPSIEYVLTYKASDIRRYYGEDQERMRCILMDMWALKLITYEDVKQYPALAPAAIFSVDLSDWSSIEKELQRVLEYRSPETYQHPDVPIPHLEELFKSAHCDRMISYLLQYMSREFEFPEIERHHAYQLLAKAYKHADAITQKHIRDALFKKLSSTAFNTDVTHRDVLGALQIIHAGLPEGQQSSFMLEVIEVLNQLPRTNNNRFDKIMTFYAYCLRYFQEMERKYETKQALKEPSLPPLVGIVNSYSLGP